MGALNFRGQAPFLTYLTVFKSRLGVANIVLPLTGFAYQSAQALSRRLKQRLSQLVTLDVEDEQTTPIFEYLTEKKLVSAKERTTGRYKEFSLIKSKGAWKATDRAGATLSQVAVFQTDLWLADPTVQSTIGVPTVENSDEVLELCFQLGLLSQAKCTLTSAGQLTNGLRNFSLDCSGNPMLLGMEGVVLLRQIIEKDGLLLRELLRELRIEPMPISRDHVARRLVHIVQRALTRAHDMKMPPPVLTEGKKFLALLQKTAASREAASRAPGVLEHRTSPRLEWLTDFGALTKLGMPKNGFEYSVTDDATILLDILDNDASGPEWPDDAALGYWRGSKHWMDLRNKLPPIELQMALRQGYRIMQRSVGPTAIREVCFAAGVIAPNLTLTIEEFGAYLTEWASHEPGITVSGGRYSRKPQLIHIATDVLGKA